MDAGSSPAAKTLPRWTSLSSPPARIPNRLPLSGSRWTIYSWVGQGFFEAAVTHQGKPFIHRYWRKTMMEQHDSIKLANERLARQINQEARQDPGSPYAGKLVGIANGKVVVVADTWQE